MFNSDIFANRPAAGVVGRIFISTDTKVFYRDTGTTWELVGGSGTGTISGSGTAGTLPIWTESSVLGDSLLSQTTGVINAGGQINITTGQPLTLGLQNLQLPTGVSSTISAGLSVRTGVTSESIVQFGNNLNTYYTGNVDASKAGAMIRLDTRGVAPIPGASAYSVFQIQTRSAGTADPNYTVPIQIAAAPSGSFCIDGSGYGYFYNRLRVGNSTAAPTNALSITGNIDVAGYGTFDATLTAANNASSVSIVAIDRLSYSAGFSSNNIGAIYGSIAGYNLQTFAGSATFAQANVVTGLTGINSIDFSSAGSTITMTQAAGIRAMAGNITQVQYQGTNSGTITHLAVQQNLGFYRPSAATGTLTITNAYSHLINALDDYGAGFSFTNRWGIYQAGSSDKNYFAANMLLGSTLDNGNKLQVTGNAYISLKLGIGTANPLVECNVIGNVRAGYANSVGLTIGLSPVGVPNNDVCSYILWGDSASFGGQNGDLIYIPRTSTNADHRWYTGNGVLAVEKMTLKSVGNLLLGSTTDNGNKLQVNGNGYYNGNIGVGRISARTRAEFNTGLPTTIPIYTDTTNGIVVTDGGAIYGRIGVSDFASAASGYPTYIQAGDFDSATYYNILLNPIGGNVCIGSTNNTGNKLYLNGSLRIDGQSSGTAGGSSGQHLIINLDGTTYKIALLNP